MVCNPAEALQRELRVALSTRPRETTTPESITNKVNIWRNVFKNQGPHHSNIRLVDTTNINEAKMIEQIGMDILDTLEQKSKKP